MYSQLQTYVCPPLYFCPLIFQVSSLPVDFFFIKPSVFATYPYFCGYFIRAGFPRASDPRDSEVQATLYLMAYPQELQAVVSIMCCCLHSWGLCKVPAWRCACQDLGLLESCWRLAPHQLLSRNERFRRAEFTFEQRLVTRSYCRVTYLGWLTENKIFIVVNSNLWDCHFTVNNTSDSHSAD